MSDTVKTIPTMADAKRMKNLSANAADRTRIAGLDLATGIDEAMADSARLEAARLRFMAGKSREDNEQAIAAEELSKTHLRRAEALRVETDLSRKNLEEELVREEKEEGENEKPPEVRLDPFKLLVHVRKGERGIKGVDVELLANNKSAGVENTNEDGIVIFEIKTGRTTRIEITDTTRFERETSGIRSSDTADEVKYVVVAKDKNGETIARAPVDVKIEAGKTAEMTLPVR